MEALRCSEGVTAWRQDGLTYRLIDTAHHHYRPVMTKTANRYRGEIINPDGHVLRARRFRQRVSGLNWLRIRAGIEPIPDLHLADETRQRGLELARRIIAAAKPKPQKRPPSSATSFELSDWITNKSVDEVLLARAKARCARFGLTSIEIRFGYGQADGRRCRTLHVTAVPQEDAAHV